MSDIALAVAVGQLGKASFLRLDCNVYVAVREKSVNAIFIINKVFHGNSPVCQILASKKLNQKPNPPIAEER